MLWSCLLSSTIKERKENNVKKKSIRTEIAHPNKDRMGNPNHRGNPMV